MLKGQTQFAMEIKNRKNEIDFLSTDKIENDISNVKQNSKW